jgi:hypothetical protein
MYQTLSNRPTTSSIQTSHRNQKNWAEICWGLPSKTDEDKKAMGFRPTRFGEFDRLGAARPQYLAIFIGKTTRPV